MQHFGSDIPACCSIVHDTFFLTEMPFKCDKPNPHKIDVLALPAFQSFPFVSASLCLRSNRTSPCIGSNSGSVEQEDVALGQVILVLG